MKYPPPLEARFLFIDGPVSLFIHQAPPQEILDAYARLGRLVAVTASTPHLPSPGAADRSPGSPGHDCGGGA